MREDGFKVKWGRDVEDTRGGKKEGMFVCYGTISPGEEVALVSEWDVTAAFDAGWRVKSEWLTTLSVQSQGNTVHMYSMANRGQL